MDKLRTYFDAMNGTSDWSSVKPLFDDLFHDDLVVVTANGELDRDAWGNAVQGMLAAGTKVSDLTMHSHDDGTIHYYTTITETNGTVIKVSSTATLKDGKIVHVQPFDHAA